MRQRRRALLELLVIDAERRRDLLTDLDLVLRGRDGEALSAMLRPGSAGANTLADHFTVLDAAVAQLPPREVSTQQAATVLNVSRPTVVKVTITRDAHAEPNETLALTLHSPVGARLGTPTGTGTIIDDDKPEMTTTTTVIGSSQRRIGTAGRAIGFHRPSQPIAGMSTDAPAGRTGVSALPCRHVQ